MNAVPAFIDHRELVAGGDHRRRGDGVGRIDKAGERVDLVLGEQFLDRDLGFGAVRRLGIALDERDLVGFDLIGIELEIKLHAALDLLRKLGADAGIGQDQADFYFLRRRFAASSLPRPLPRPRRRPQSLV